MPRVRPLTRAQAREESYRNRTMALAKGLGAAKSYQGLHNEDLCDRLGVGINTMPRLLKADGEVRLSVTAFWRALDLAGLEIRQKNIKLDCE